MRIQNEEYSWHSKLGAHGTTVLSWPICRVNNAQSTMLGSTHNSYPNHGQTPISLFDDSGPQGFYPRSGAGNLRAGIPALPGIDCRTTGIADCIREIQADMIEALPYDMNNVQGRVKGN
jgi:hypothetical protein